MNDLDQQLNDDMAAVDRAIAPPSIDVDGLARLGRGERRRRTGIAVSAGAALAVVATVGALAVVPGGGPSRTTLDPAGTPSATLPADPVVASGDAPRLIGGTLYASGASYDYNQFAFSSPQYAAGTTLATVRAEGGWHVVQMRDGVITEYARADDRVLGSELSADGLTAAVQAPGNGGDTAITLFDVESGEPLGTLEVPRVEDAGDPSLVSVTDDRRVVFFRDSLGAFIWSPGSEAVPVTGLQGGFSSYGGSWPGGMATDSADTQDTVLGTIDAAGAWTETYRVPRSPDYSWGPSGDTWVVGGFEEGDDNVYLEGLDRERTVLLTLSAGEYVDVVGWESATAIVLDVEPETGAATRMVCDVVELDCTEVAGR